MKILKETFNVSVEDLYNSIEEVEAAWSQLRSALFTLEYYAEKNYPKYARYFESSRDSIQDDINTLFDDIEDLKGELDVQA